MTTIAVNESLKLGIWNRGDSEGRDQVLWGCPQRIRQSRIRHSRGTYVGGLEVAPEVVADGARLGVTVIVARAGDGAVERAFQWCAVQHGVA